jgi:8-oxo-dGTP pyrophosphatase MutT (NUDIX family)
VARLTKQSGSDPRGRRGRTARATSSGGIVIRHTDGVAQICIGRRKREKDPDTWTLPKGTPSGTETVHETALREVAEETGLEVVITENGWQGAIEYFFTQSGTRIHKTVHFFLMDPVGGSLDDHDREFDEVRWVAVKDARWMLSYPTERQIMEEALAAAGVEA